MNKAQETSRLYEIVAQSIQKRIIYPSRENVTLNHDTWELEYEPVYEENPQDDNSFSDSAYENNHYKKINQAKISSIMAFIVGCLILYFAVKPFYEVYQQDKIFFEKHNAIHAQIVKRIMNYERPVDDIKKYEELYAEENKLRPRLGELEKCEQCSYLKSYVEALLCYDEYKQDGNIEHIKKANTKIKNIPSSYQEECADQINYSRDYFRKLEDEFEKQRKLQEEQEARAARQNKIRSGRDWFEEEFAESRARFEKEAAESRARFEKKAAENRAKFWEKGKIMFGFFVGGIFIISIAALIING